MCLHLERRLREWEHLRWCKHEDVSSNLQCPQSLTVAIAVCILTAEEKIGGSQDLSGSLAQLIQEARQSGSKGRGKNTEHTSLTYVKSYTKVYMHVFTCTQIHASHTAYCKHIKVSTQIILLKLNISAFPKCIHFPTWIYSFSFVC